MVRFLSKEALHIPHQRLLQCFKDFENALESQLKYSTGDRAWNNFCVWLDQWCSPDRNLCDETEAWSKLRGRDSRLEIRNWDSRLQNLSNLPKFLKCRRYFWVETFLISGIFRHVLVVSYLQTEQTKTLNFINFTKPFLWKIPSLKTCCLQNQEIETLKYESRDRNQVSGPHQRLRHMYIAFTAYNIGFPSTC